MARFDALRQMRSLLDPWRGWLACGIYVFLALTGTVGVARGDRAALMLALIGVYGLGAIIWSWYRVDAHRSRTATRVMGSAEPGWAREVPITPAVVVFARRRLLAASILAGIAVCAIAITVVALTARLPPPAHTLAVGLSLPTLLAIAICVLAPLAGDARATMSREVAGPLSLTIGWRGAAAAYMLRVGEETVWIPMAAAECLRGVRWGIVTTTLRTVTLMGVWDTEGEMIYRTPGYPGTTTRPSRRE